MKNFWTLTRKGRLVGLALLTATAFSACGEDGQDGGDGAASLIETSDASAEECATGGSVITSGLDTNGDGELSEDEVVSSTVICNGDDGAEGPQGEEGPKGPNGEDGANGANGVNGSVEILEETAGANCADGGLAFVSTVGDESTTSYFCNQTCEAGDYVGIEVGEGSAPEVVYNGFDSATFPVTADQTDFTVSAIYSTPGFEFDLSYDDVDGLTVAPTAGEGDLEIAVAFSDGCGYYTDTVRVENVEFGESTVYLAHFFSGAGAVDLNLAGTDQTVATFGFTDVLGPLDADSGMYTFDVLIDDEVAGTSPELVFEPNTDYVVFAYSNEGELDFGIREIDMSEPEEETFHARFTHAAEGVDAVNIALIGDVDEIAVFDLAFPDSTDFQPFTPSNNYVAVDADGDLTPDFDFFQTEGLFQEGAIIDGFVFTDSEDRVYLSVVDYVNGDVVTVPANVVEQVFTMPEGFGVDVDGGVLTTGSADIEVTGCGTVLGMSVYVVTSGYAYRSEVQMGLTAPDGTDVLFWDFEGGTAFNFDGFFPGDYQSIASTTAPISSFIGVDADGTWTFNAAAIYTSNFDEVELHILCGN